MLGVDGGGFRADEDESSRTARLDQFKAIAAGFSTKEMCGKALATRLSAQMLEKRAKGGWSGVA